MVDIHQFSSFAEFLREHIAAKGLTKPAVASQLGVSRNAVYKYLDGTDTPSDDKLKRFAEQAGYPYAELVRLVHEPPDDGRERPTFPVYTERGAIIGRTFESIEDPIVRAAVYELVMSLARESQKKTG